MKPWEVRSLSIHPLQMPKNNKLKGGLFDGRGKPQPLALKKSAERQKTPEKNIQSLFFGWRNTHKRDYPILNSIFAVPNGIWTFKSVAVSQVRQGLTAGIPDVICLSPSIDGLFHGLLIEFKNEQGEVTDEQKFFLSFFADLGYRTSICRRWEDAADVVNTYLGLNVPVFRR